MESTATHGGTTNAATSSHTATVAGGTVAGAAAAAATTTTTTTTTTSSSTGGIATRDHVYCLELAKRSVARAALHLGIQTMTSDVLNVLGDVLCEYIQRLAAVLSHNVESSNRSSQHVNALDALRAVELCTSPAVSRVHFINTPNDETAGAGAGGTGNPANGNAAGSGTTNHNMMEENGNAASSNSNSSNNPTHPPTSWQGLAAFCFGPTWMEAPTTKELAEVAELQGAGGKVGPKAMIGDDDDEDDEEGGRGAKDCQEGWRAPFPDEVPQFPQCTSPSAVSNPHAMTNTQVLVALYGKQQSQKAQKPTTAAKMIDDLVRGPDLISSEEAQQERQVMEDDLNRIPVSAWGGLGDTKSSHTNKNPIGITSAAVSEAVPTASKINEDTTSTGDDDTNSNKRKLEEDKDNSNNGGAAGAAADKNSSDSNIKTEEGVKKEDDSNKDKMDTSGDGGGKKDKDKKDDKKAEGDGSQPPKKKVKLEDGSAAKAKTTPKKSKKKNDDKKDKDTTETKTKNDANNNKKDGAGAKGNDGAAAGGGAGAAGGGTLGTGGLNSSGSGGHHHGGHKGPTGPTYNYVPTFYPPIPTMATPGDDVRKTTVVDLLEQPASTSATASGRDGGDGTGGETDPTEASNTTTSGLRSALVQLGTSYWGSQADFAPPPPPAPASSNKLDDASIVPVGRSQAPAPQGGPIVPLGRASGSRVSRILEGSMDAATMQQ